MKKLMTTTLLLSSLYSLGHTHRGAISHAPIGVGADHTHKKGEFMMSLRHTRMKKDQTMRGSDDISNSDYTQMMKLKEMNMTMTMLGAMYGITDRITMAAMLSYVTKEMEMTNNMSGMTMKNSARNIADSTITAIYDLAPKTQNTILNAKLSLSLPTGETDRTNVSGTRLPYGIQLGSGTFDPSLGLTYKKYLSEFEIGTQLNYKFSLGENDEGYSRGDSYSLNLWGAYAFSSKVSSSIRLNYSWMDSIDGTDKNLTISSNMNTSANPDNYGGKQLDVFIGTNLMFNGEKSTDNRIAFEYGLPLYQDLNGIGLGMDHKFVIGWQKQLF